VIRKKGAQTLPDLSIWVEEVLETIRPGSRVQSGPKLPKVGANSVETGPATEGEAKEVEAAKESSIPSVKSEPTKAAKPTPAKSKSTANPSGISEPLTSVRFQEAVTNTLEPWFIKFYAPWCHHCQAMQPNWAQMAREMQGQLNVGEVNCDEQKGLCKDAGVKGYPTVLFFRGGERVEYNGMRGLGDFIDYAKKALAVASGVADVDAAEFKKMEETEEVIFTYFYDHATTSEDFQALERLTLHLVGKGRLVKTNDEELFKRFKITTWPRLMVSRDGKPSYYGPITPKDMRDTQKILTWMKSVWLPIVPELKSDNARDIMDGKLVVLAILSHERKGEFVTAKRELKNAALEWIDREEHMYELERQELRDAKNLRIEEAEDKGDQRALRAAKQIRINMDDVNRRQVGFAWVDGIFWERWIKTTYGIDVADGEMVIINDEAVGLLIHQSLTLPFPNLQLTCFRRTTATGTLLQPANPFVPRAPPSSNPFPKSQRTPLPSLRNPHPAPSKASSSLLAISSPSILSSPSVWRSALLLLLPCSAEGRARAMGTRAGTSRWEERRKGSWEEEGWERLIRWQRKGLCKGFV
jgi:protein disulfide-isomerase